VVFGTTIRLAFEIGGRQMNGGLASRVPAGIASQPEQSYDPKNPRVRLDVFYPAAATTERNAHLTVVWIHGGGFLAGKQGESVDDEPTHNYRSPRAIVSRL
jgi:acetyl esterase/lipase